MQARGFLPREAMDALFGALAGLGARCIGPRVRDGAIVYEALGGAADLPHGTRDVQAPGSYRLASTEDARCFAWANGPQALKPLVFKPRETLWRAQRDDAGQLAFHTELPAPPLTAVIGVRACDLAALDLQDRHFLNGDIRDPHYAARREKLLLIAVNCTHPAATCFCDATGDGPLVRGGCDLLLDELDDGFVVTAGNERGEALAGALPLLDLDAGHREALELGRSRAANAQVRHLPAGDLPRLLFDHLEHPAWAEIAERCLSCGNCTAVCPTCFCHSTEEATELDGRTSRMRRLWDSCFTEGHSYIHGITLRAETPLRYRQWLTHKFGGWQEQYGRSGCVGCGRCITWCPAGIDVTESLRLIAGEPAHV